MFLLVSLCTVSCSDVVLVVLEFLDGVLSARTYGENEETDANSLTRAYSRCFSSLPSHGMLKSKFTGALI